jgi:hypothetical protein
MHARMIFVTTKFIDYCNICQNLLIDLNHAEVSRLFSVGAMADLSRLGWLDRGAEGAKWKRPGMVLEVGEPR